MIRMIAVPNSSWSRRITSSTWACTVTSSAVVGSSAISRSGLSAIAIAIITRCRMPAGELVRVVVDADRPPAGCRPGRAARRLAPGPPLAADRLVVGADHLDDLPADPVAGCRLDSGSWKIMPIRDAADVPQQLRGVALSRSMPSKQRLAPDVGAPGQPGDRLRGRRSCRSRTPRRCPGPARGRASKDTPADRLGRRRRGVEGDAQSSTSSSGTVGSAALLVLRVSHTLAGSKFWIAGM